ncbi:hypothetical protein NUU61_007457 [Penicillium alfredii]|uniref:tRNA(Phe) 7-[(3-amino-3-carboxypropyl)-4-demethylwyosine(37)-N(4)]-methyltransferase n=1 Tax=Penicillium alfredii TaxID=1506179 RepID=A0A9W9F343_9EURO|nr:uncharacterized protein NUU61_007457 [Penicillium alfredii]KAJ5092587.1 hypothetical protein NUU61_007457 [Penicillium alfredii]
MSSDLSAGHLPAAFQWRKIKILEELSVPDTEYTDLSPKGCVDEGIRDLIRDLNGLPGLVTTSSCAGRVSVFLEGRKKSPEPSQETQRQFAPSGGKGAGRWLYVSHEPLSQPETHDATVQKSLHDLFGMVPGDGKPPKLAGENASLRLVRFHFEPLILHIMAATLSHAQPVLSAASASGFRESGLQSLRCLEGDEGPSPIVAVRSSGLSLESVIGYCDEHDSASEPVIRSLVTEEYLEMLVAMSNERFAVNADRRERFCAGVMEMYSPDGTPGTAKGRTKSRPPGWEDPIARKERKRAEGLMRKKLLDEQKIAESAEDEATLEGLADAE